MVWQDIGFTIGQGLLGLVIIPTLIDSERSVSRWTSVPTAVVLYSFCFLYFTLGFHFSLIVTLFTAMMWSGIALWRA